MERPIGQAEFNRLLATFERTAFRFETRNAYVLGYEQAELARFLDGQPVPPPEVSWWRPWLDRIAALAADGRHVSRVRVIDEPPSDYQRWELWAAPWHAAAGERITYITRAVAGDLGLPLGYDWWLLDEQVLLITRFAADGTIAGKTLDTDRDLIARHCAWRDLAVRNATPAAEIIGA